MFIGDIETYNINGFECVTVKNFARIINRSESSIRRLMSSGNRYRKIRKVTLDGKSFIPIIELEKFPFTLQGRVGQSSPVVHWKANRKGEVVIHLSDWYCSTENLVRCDEDCKSCRFGRQVGTKEPEVEDDDARNRV